MAASKSLGLIALAIIAGGAIWVYRNWKVNADAEARVTVAYEAIPSVKASETYSVSVNGHAVPVQFYRGATENVGFARFSFSGPAKVVVTVSQPVSRYVLSPKQSRISAVVSDNKLSFTLNSPQRLILHDVNALPEQLFLLADAPEDDPPKPGTSDVINAMALGNIDNTNKKDNSSAINQVISRISTAGGGTVFFPAGVYNVQSAIEMKSNVTVYLAPGAVFQVPPTYNCCFANQSLINFSDVANARLIGRGIINGNATNIPSKKADFSLIYTENANNIAIEGLTLLDAGSAAIRLVDARSSAVRDIKIIANNPNSEPAGIAFDSSSDIVVDNAFIYTSNDNTSEGGGTGVRGTVRDNENLVLQNSVLYNARVGAAFKIGTDDRQDSIHGITFSNIDVVRCTQLAAFYPTFGANIENVSLQDIRAERVTDRPFEFHAIVPTWESNWNGRIGHIHGVHIVNVSIDSTGTRHSDFLGFSRTQDISGVNFTNFRQNGRLVHGLDSAELDIGAYVSNVIFQR